MTSIYTDGSYLRNNPHWHAEDSAWKAEHIARILERNDVAPATVCEIGCGAGDILTHLSKRLSPSTRFVGYEISPDAYAICSPKAEGNLQFHFGNLLEASERFDLVMAIDVFEHVEDYFDFLRKLRGKGTHTLFHIPLELSAWMVARGRPLLHQRHSVGHIHHFSKETALATLEDTGYRIVDHCCTSWGTELSSIGWKSRLLKWPRKALYRADPDLAARMLGGYSLLVLAE
jgi:cyclopropane fatty-acyl-phospholipid synthase-like methyltransferase